MADLSKAEFERAVTAGARAQSGEPRAASARFAAGPRQIIVELINGCTFTFPPGVIQGLENATDEQLGEIEVLGAGYGLHWEALNLDYSVPGLLAGIFGTKSHMARLAGQASSPAKSAAARANGAKGGRPRKAA